MSHEVIPKKWFDPKVATKVFAISNEKLLTNFENYRDTLHAKHRQSPGLFKKEDWKVMAEGQQREKYISWHSQFSDKFLWNYKSKPSDSDDPGNERECGVADLSAGVWSGGDHG